MTLTSEECRLILNSLVEANCRDSSFSADVIRGIAQKFETEYPGILIGSFFDHMDRKAVASMAREEAAGKVAETPA